MQLETTKDIVQKTYVQFGCGLCAPEGWINFDSSPRLRFERIPGVSAVAQIIGKRLFPVNVKFGDVVFGLPLADSSVDGIYASHVLEHLSRTDIVTALANTIKLLNSGGVFRMIVPDLEWRVRRYVADRKAAKDDGADELIGRLNMGGEVRPRGAMALMRASFGNSGHFWMYDEAQMFALLKQAGFIDVRRCDFHDSGDAMFDAVEDIGRFIEPGGGRELAIQARKP